MPIPMAAMKDKPMTAVPRRRRTGRSAGQTLVVGLTGSIGMGKSTVSGWIRESLVPVYDANAVVHELYAAGGAAVAPVRQLFGSDVIDSSGGINRDALTKFVVGEANSANLRRLEEVVFPLVDLQRGRFIREAQRRGEPVIVLDIPLLFERGHEVLCDIVFVVSAPHAVQRQRVLERPGMTDEKLASILIKQVPDAEKRAMADFVLDTGIAPARTREALDAFIADCRQRVETERRRRRLISVATVLLAMGVAVVATRRARRPLAS